MNPRSMKYYLETMCLLYKNASRKEKSTIQMSFAKTVVTTESMP